MTPFIAPIALSSANISISSETLRSGDDPFVCYEHIISMFHIHVTEATLAIPSHDQ